PAPPVEPAPPVDTPEKPVIPDIEVGPMIDVDNTLSAIGNTAYQLASVLNARKTSLLNLLDEDCTVNQGRFCVGLGSRFADSDTINTTTGLLTLGYQSSEKIRLGVTLDQTLSQTLPSEYDSKSAKPGFGIYAVLQPSNEVEIRLGAAWKEDDLEISRQQLSNTEVGKGEANLKGVATTLKVTYKAFERENLTISPFGGVTYSKISRDGYSEYNDITFAAKYNNINFESTSLKGGVKAQYQLSSQVSVDVNTQIEHDIKHEYSDFITDIDTIGMFKQPIQDMRKTRVASDVNVRFTPAKDTEYYAGFYWSQSSLNKENEAGLNIGYKVSF
ncbi:autotransporter outer membrane beta-barrel domain-containing protein, partial [Salmonella enterica subsp. enterica serovar Typhimurium]|nr:autotransporter outer membrane beta-barrel domain-containing protein [Salmonella enterica subsp. enterica serovar Typhimurium]